MKPILALNAFDMNDAAELGGALEERVRQRAKLFGAASVLFYDRPLEFVRGEGCWLYDADGVAYLDAYNNVPSVGHCHPHVVEAATRQMGKLNIHNRYLHQGIIDYAERLLATLPAPLSNVTFTCTGSESNDLALRLASNFTGGEGIVVTEAAYHGNTAWLQKAVLLRTSMGRLRGACAWSRPPILIAFRRSDCPTPLPATSLRQSRI